MGCVFLAYSAIEAQFSSIDLRYNPQRMVKQFTAVSVRKLRERTGMGLNQFAKFHGFSPSAQSLWENGGRPVKGVANAFFNCLEKLLDREKK